MPIPSPEPTPSETLQRHHASALLDFHNCQAAQALAQANEQAAGQELNAAILENKQILTEQLNHVLDVSMSYALWANAMDSAFLDAEEALSAAEEEYALWVNAFDAHSQFAFDALKNATQTRLAAAEVHATCALERQLASEELDDATAYLKRLQMDGKAVFQAETDALRAAWQSAAAIAQAAQLETVTAQVRL